MMKFFQGCGLVNAAPRLGMYYVRAVRRGKHDEYALQ